jgi:hypothetical protein
MSISKNIGFLNRKDETQWTVGNIFKKLKKEVNASL